MVKYHYRKGKELKMEVEELIEDLMSGKKMTFLESDTSLGGWCEYNNNYVLIGRSPFRYISSYGVNEPMEEDIWDHKNWVEYKPEPKWRLPTIRELLSVIDFSLKSPATNIDGFKPKSYWSSTTNIDYKKFAWCVNLDYGKCDWFNVKNKCYVRCVLVDSNEIVWSKSSDEEMDWEEAIEYAENLEE